MKMSYELLLNELETLQKGYAADADDKVIQAAAAENDSGDEELDEDGKPIAKKKKPMAEPDGDEAPGKPFGKSFTLVGEDGAETEAFDGTEFVKSLHEEVQALGKTVEAEKADLAKSIQAMVDVIKSQGTLIKSLQADYATLANQGAGRKSVTMPNQSMSKAMGPVNTETFMMKANAAFNSGKISGKDLTVCDVSLRHGEAIDAGLLNRIFES
jgi:hypothetical protein